MNRLRNALPSLRAGLASVLVLVAAPALWAEDLEKQMLREAPKILAQLKGRGCKTVGVLKFRVKKGNEPLTDNAGPLNLTLANRLEMALILANKVQQPLGIIHDASAVAARLRGASHVTAEGRHTLFEADYPLAWGKEKVRPDALLTGIALISPDLRDMTVGILAFDKDGKGLRKVAQFTATVDAVALVESGESFLLRGASTRARGEDHSQASGTLDAGDGGADGGAGARTRNRIIRWPMRRPRWSWKFATTARKCPWRSRTARRASPSRRRGRR